MPAELEATLYLEPWQKRMVKDFSSMRRLVNRIVIKPGKGDCLASYKVPALGMRRDDWVIYLTDNQMLQLKEQLKLRAPVSSVNVTAEAIKSGSIAFG